MLETEERKQISPEGDKNKRAIDMEQFGGFVTEMRKEHGFTQKELAERLFISNKAVSKWERGLSMPDIALLEPLARELGVTVVELLHGRRACEKEGAEELSEKELLEYIEGFQILSAEEKEKLKIRRKKMGLLYFAEIILATAEVLLLYLAGPSLGIMAFDVSIDMLTIEPLIIFFGIWVFFFLPEKLPPIYDKIRLSTYIAGAFRMELNGLGVCFNNRNWPYIMKALRNYIFWTPLCWPAVYVPVRLLVPDMVWLFGRIAVLLMISLGGLFVPMVIMAKKYE